LGIYLLIATILSSIFLILWRWYAHYLDNAIAGLYANFIFCESSLGLPDDLGTVGNLLGMKVFRDKGTEWNGFTPVQKAKVVSKLFEKKRLGYRGHRGIDIVALVAIIVMATVCVFSFRGDWWTVIINIKLKMSRCLYIAIILVPILMVLLYYWFYCQKNPREKDLENAFAETDKLRNKNFELMKTGSQLKSELSEFHKDLLDFESRILTLKTQVQKLIDQLPNDN